MRKLSLAAVLCIAAMPAMAQITDKMAQDAYIYGYSMDEAYKFFYETAIKTGTPRNRFQNIRHLADDTHRTPGHQQRYPAPARLAGSQCGAGDHQRAGYGQRPLLDPAHPGHGPLHHLDERLTHPRHQGGVTLQVGFLLPDKGGIHG